VSTRRYFAPCARGLEYLLVDELKALGAGDVREGLAGVRFSGDAALGYRACLWSRLASRILLPLAEFEAGDAQALYDGVAAIEWDQHLDPAGTLAIDAHGATRGLNNAPFAAQRAKDAIADQCRARHGVRPSVDTDDPDLRLALRLHRERATLSIDLSGPALFMRGYRRGSGEAPLKENLAVAMLMRARWLDAYAAGGPLVDPMCGAGTLLIEGAWMAADVAPALQRERFGFLGWRGFEPALWQALRAEAVQRAQAGLTALRPVFFGSDTNAAVLGAAKHNAQAAGIAGFLVLKHVPVARLEAPPHDAPGLAITNPPYGERLGEVEALRATYAELGATLRRAFVGWRAALITNHDDLGRATGLRADRRYTLYNGALECALLCFDTIAAPAQTPREPRPLSAGAQALANRIAKNVKHLRKRLEREGVGCYRAYDADLPEYAAAIDVYGERAAPHTTWLHVQEYAAPSDIPAELAQRRLREIVRVAGEAFEVPRERIALKTRRPQSRQERYQRQDRRGQFLEVEEGGLGFLVNLFDYLDTGLFLDHRPLRARLRELARGKRFLNLFCYTATASVYAAAGAARSTTSVDLSATYLDWGARNLALNGFGDARHRLLQADVMSWLASARERYDLIYVDPPTFSNSKRADDFDVQRHHVELLHGCARCLAPGGLIVFSNNLRRFRLDVAALSELDVKDITRATIPPDFARDARIHYAFEVRPR
jgi:23S rRNA (guanine2445-N2)-methyltransferase / 23S rRNA (guanine2069-N7)-methyltransferase